MDMLFFPNAKSTEATRDYAFKAREWLHTSNIKNEICLKRLVPASSLQNGMHSPLERVSVQRTMHAIKYSTHRKDISNVLRSCH